MQCGMVGRMGPGMRQVVGLGNRSTGWGNFGGECGAPHCNRGEFAASRLLSRSHCDFWLKLLLCFQWRRYIVLYYVCQESLYTLLSRRSLEVLRVKRTALSMFPRRFSLFLVINSLLLFADCKGISQNSSLRSFCLPIQFDFNKKDKEAYSSLCYKHRTATGTHVPYGITQCYLPPGRGDIPALTPAD